MGKPLGAQAWGIPLALSICYLLVQLEGSRMGAGHDIVALLSLSTARAWWKAPWCLLTYGLVHTTWWHFATNMAILTALIGSRRLERKEVRCLFTAGILGGGLLFTLVGNGTLVGASAGIAALIPLCIYRVTEKHQGWTLLLIVGIVLLDFLTRNRLSNLPFATHLVGYAIGIGYLLYARSGEARAKREEEQKQVVKKVNTSGYNSLSNEEQKTLHTSCRHG